MVSRLFLAGACALGLATASAAPAAADLSPPPTPAATDIPLYIPAAIQVWSPEGLTSTIRCWSLRTHPACDPGGWPDNNDVFLKEKGGYRYLARSGRWFEMGGNETTVDAIDHADATGGPGATEVITGLDELDVWDPRA